MKATTRRRARLRSAQYPAERWKPSAAVVVLAVGLLVGGVLGLRDRLFDRSAMLSQHYMLLASDLYALGAPLPSIRDRLVSVGYANPSDAVLQMANHLSGSQDKVEQQEGDQLHQFAEALIAGSGRVAATTAGAPADVISVASSAGATVTAVPATPTASPPTATPVASASPATVSPATSVTAAPAANPPPAPAVAVNPAPAPEATATSAPSGAKSGTSHSSDRQPAIMRRDSTSKSTAIAIIPYGATVQILGVTQGEAIEPGEARWWHAKYNGHDGYIYFKLVQTGG